MTSPILGIDLGTTNSVVAVADGTEVRALADSLGRRLIPSTVSFHPDGTILVGHEARDRRLVDAANTVFSTKRLIGRPFSAVEVRKSAERFPFVLEPTPTGGVQVRVRRGTYTLPEISAFVLRHVRMVAEEALGVPCQRAIITVPANFNELQRSATQAAAKIAGIDVVRMVNEPTAATLAYGLGKEGAERVLVYDLGGGTFDVTVLDLDHDALEVVSTAGDTFLGGDDFDLMLAERMSDACLRQYRFDPRSDVQTFERLRAAAEWAKCQLSTVPEVELAVEELFHETGGRAVNFVFQARRADFEGLIRPLIARTFDVVNEALRACGRRPKEIDTVVLVGGSTRIPMVMQMVGEFFTRSPRFERDPDLVVAQGAALQGWALASRSPEPSKAGRPPMPRPRAPAVPRPREPLPKQPAFAPPEPPAPSGRWNEPARPTTDSGLGPGPKRQTNPGMVGPGTAVGRVQLRGRTDDRQARAIEAPDALPPPRARQTSPGMSSPSLKADLRGLGLRPGVVQAPVAVVGSIRPPTAPGTTRANLDELDSVETLPEKTGTSQQLPAADKQWRKATLLGAMAPLPKAAALEADAPFDVGEDTARSLRTSPNDTLEDEPTKIARVPEPPEEVTRAGRTPEPPDEVTRLAPAPQDVARAAPMPERAPTRTAQLGELPANPEPAARPAPPPPAAAKPAPAPPAAPPAAPASRPRPAARDIGSWVSEPPSSPSIPLPVAPPTPALPLLFSEPAPAVEARPANVVPGVPHQPSIAIAQGRAPLLMDVTPQALGIETVGGYCQHVVSRNAPVPTEKSRVFATGIDDQTSVEIRICQGDSNVYGENESLGVIVLDALRRAKRGDVRIEVTFMLDPSGVLDVRATDLDTRRIQKTRIQLRGGMAVADVEAARARQERELGGRA